MEIVQHAAAQWHDRREAVFVEFCVEDSKNVQVHFDTSKFVFSCVSGEANKKHQNTVDLFGEINPKESKHKRTDRLVVCYLRKAQPGIPWPRLTKLKEKVNWLSLDFNNWTNWEDDSDDDLRGFGNFSEMLKKMGGDDFSEGVDEKASLFQKPLGDC